MTNFLPKTNWQSGILEWMAPHGTGGWLPVPVICCLSWIRLSGLSLWDFIINIMSVYYPSLDLCAGCQDLAMCKTIMTWHLSFTILILDQSRSIPLIIDHSVTLQGCGKTMLNLFMWADIARQTKNLLVLTILLTWVNFDKKTKSKYGEVIWWQAVCFLHIWFPTSFRTCTLINCSAYHVANNVMAGKKYFFCLVYFCLEMGKKNSFFSNVKM